MNLQEFTKETLVQIVYAVNEAKGELSKVNAKTPNNVIANGHHIMDDKTKEHVIVVDFDVAITTETTKENKGGVGLQVASLNFGGKFGHKDNNQTFSRVKFSLPLVLPGKPTEY